MKPMTLHEIRDDYLQNNRHRVEFVRQLYQLPADEVKRLLEIETPEERMALRMMVYDETHVAKAIDDLANVH